SQVGRAPVGQGGHLTQSRVRVTVSDPNSDGSPVGHAPMGQGQNRVKVTGSGGRVKPPNQSLRDVAH
ncbi:hypothetical protein, partial [Mobiluncus sp.]|uniref:hypothetical protein n=1 Tax=Mobiluncus sp. TaxID=47293 RepID=UPI002A91E142